MTFTRSIMQQQQRITVGFRDSRQPFQDVFDAHQFGGGGIQIVRGETCTIIPVDLIDSVFIDMVTIHDVEDANVIISDATS